MIGEDAEIRSAADVGNEFCFGDAGKFVFDVGGVGRSCDGDSRASVLILDEGTATVRWHRIAYDIDTTLAKIRAIPEFPPHIAERLEQAI